MEIPLVSYPGLRQPLRATYTLAHGITPGVCEIECAPQTEPIAATGPLALAFGDVQIVFPSCRADLATARRTADGLIWSVSILDRRWRWTFGAISGEYNRRDDSFRTIPPQDRPIVGVEKTPQQLAALLLKALGETQFDVSRVPNETRPHVAWAAANPALELAELADSLGCRIVLHLDSHVSLEPVGEGRPLPILPALVEGSLTADPPDPPDEVLVLGAPTIAQTRFDLEAVGIDADGQVRPIDQLSYAPAGGWDGQTELFSDISDMRILELCVQTVYRWYRIRIDRRRPVAIPNVGLVSDLQQILPLEPRLVESVLDAGEYRRKRPRVFGEFWIGNVGSPKNPETDSEYPGSWTLLADRGVVAFAHPVRRWDSSAGRFTAARLKLECAFPVRSESTGALQRYEFRQPTGSRNGTGPEVVRGEAELQLQTYESFNSSGQSTGWRTVRPRSGPGSLDEEARGAAMAALSRYQTGATADATYAGLVPIDPDGAIVQVTWTIDPRPLTRASRARETHSRIPPYRTRRFHERLRRLL